MNAARLTRRWQEAAGDPARMAEALIDEINDPATGLVTRDFLRAELADVRQEIGQLRHDVAQEIGEVRQEISQLRHDVAQEIGEVRQEIGQLRHDVAQEIGQLRHDVFQETGQLRQDLAGLRQEMAELESRLMWRMVTLLGAQIALVGILVTILVQVLR